VCGAQSRILYWWRPRPIWNPRIEHSCDCGGEFCIQVRTHSGAHGGVVGLQEDHLAADAIERLAGTAGEKGEKVRARGPCRDHCSIGHRGLDLLAAIDRRLLVINTLVAAAPLCGLLGTVTGILAMFGGLSRGKGAAGMQAVANGMQEALITTQTGLTIALPGLFIGLMVKNKRNEIAATLVRLESLILTTHFTKH
jgi:hypothetical protein